MTTVSSNIIERRSNFDRRSGHSAMTSPRMKAAEWVPMVLLAIGGINWGLVGLFDFNLVSFLFGEMTPLARVVYVVVGLCALYSLYMSGRMSSRPR